MDAVTLHDCPMRLTVNCELLTDGSYSTPTLLLSPRSILYAVGLMGERSMETFRPIRLSCRRPGRSVIWLFSRMMECSISLFVIVQP